VASLSPEQSNYPGREARTLYAKKLRSTRSKRRGDRKTTRRRPAATPGSDYTPINGFKLLFWMGVLLVLLVSLGLRLL
jgi:hypothetical protein